MEYFLLPALFLQAAAARMTPYEAASLRWAELAALATLAATIVVLAAAFFAAYQVREASKARQLQSALVVLQHIDSPELRMARRLVYSPALCVRLSEELTKRPSTDQLDALFKDLSCDKVDFKGFHSYLAAMEHIAILELNGLAPSRIIDMYFSRMVPQHWIALAPLIQYLRAYYNTDDFLQHFEMLNQLITAGKLKPGTLGAMEGWVSRRFLLRRRQSFRRRVRDYNVALIPDSATEQALVSLSEGIARVVHSDTILGPSRRRAHLTLYMSGFHQGGPKIRNSRVSPAPASFSAIS